METEEKIKQLETTLESLKLEFELFKQVKLTQTSLSTEEAAKEIGLTRQGILFHIRKGRIKTLGGKKRYLKISAMEIEKYKIETNK